MKKTIILMALFFVLVVFNVSAGGSYVTGTVYLGEIIEGNEVGGALVNVTCIHGYSSNAHTRTTSIITTTSSETGVIGDYYVRFPPGICKDGSEIYVEASYDEMGGTTYGEMDGSIIGGVNMAVMSGISIPEFTSITASIAILGALSIFLIRRRG